MTLRWDIRQSSQELLIVFVSLLAVNAFFYAFFVRPRVDEHRNLTTANTPRIAELERREAAVELREAYLQELQQAEDDLTRLRKDVLQTRDQRMIEAQEEFADLATQFNIASDAIHYENTILEDEGIERFAMTGPLEGGYANLRRFIHAVEESKKFLVIERVALAEGVEGGVLLSLNITLATYFDLPALQRQIKPGAKGTRKA